MVRVGELKFRLGLLLVVFGLLLSACGGGAGAGNSEVGSTKSETPSASQAAFSPTPPNPQLAAPSPTTDNRQPTTTVSPPTTVPALNGPFAPPLPPVPVLSALQGGAATLSTKWKVTLEENGPAEIVGESGGLVLAKTLNGSLYALNGSDGSITWKQIQTAPPRPTPTPLPTATSIPSPTPPNSQLATRNPQPPIPSPTTVPARAPFSVVVSGTVIIGDTAAEKLTAYEVKSGQKQWEADMKFDAPNRDPETRWLPGAIYGDLVVTAVSTKINPFAPRTTTRPEYLRLLALDIKTGQPKWFFFPNAAAPERESRSTNVIFGTKAIIVEGADFGVYGLNPPDGKLFWQALGLLFLPNSNPDALYSTVPITPGQASSPVIRRIEPTTGRLVWQRVLDIQPSTNPAIALAPDEKTAYVAVFSAGQKSLLSTFNFAINQIRQTDTSIYGLYDMLPINEGVYLIQASVKASGLIYFDATKDKPSWAVGGALELIFGPQFNADKSEAFVTFKDEAGQAFLYGLNVRTGQVLSATQIPLQTSPFAFSPDQKTLYLAGNPTKAVVTALNK